MSDESPSDEFCLRNCIICGASSRVESPFYDSGRCLSFGSSATNHNRGTLEEGDMDREAAFNVEITDVHADIMASLCCQLAWYSHALSKIHAKGIDDEAAIDAEEIQSLLIEHMDSVSLRWGSQVFTELHDKLYRRGKV